MSRAGRMVGGWLLGYKTSYKVFEEDGKNQ